MSTHSSLTRSEAPPRLGTDLSHVHMEPGKPGKLKRADKTSTVQAAKPKTTKEQRAKETAFKEQQEHQLARAGRQVSLNTKSIKALKTRESDVLKKLSALEQQLRPIREKIIHSAPTMLDPAIEEKFIVLEAKFKKLLEEHEEILSDKALLSTQKPTDLKSKRLRGRIQKFLKHSSEVDTITAKLDSTIKNLGALVRAKGSTRTNALSSYWVAHMSQVINYEDVENTARRLIAASYKFVKPLMEEIGKKGVQEALKARDTDIFSLISGELDDCKEKDQPKIVNYFLKIAEECLDKGDPRTAQSILRALRRYYYDTGSSDSSITDKEIAKRMSILPKKYFTLENQAFRAEGALRGKEREKTEVMDKIESAQRQAFEEEVSAGEEAWGTNVEEIKNTLGGFYEQIREATQSHRPDIQQQQKLLSALLSAYKTQIFPELEQRLAVLSELCQDKDTPRSQLKQLMELKDAVGQAYANIHNVEQGAPISIRPTFTGADRHDIELLFKSVDKSLESLVKLNRPQENERFSAKMEKCNAKLKEIGGLLNALPKGSKAAKELGARYEMAVWTRNNELVKFQLQLAHAALEGKNVPEARAMLNHVDVNLRHLHGEIKHFVDAEGVYRGKTAVDQFKNRVFQDLLVEKGELERQIAGLAGPDAPQKDRVKAHSTLFDTRAMSLVFDKQPKAAADLLTLRTAAFFRDIDLTKYRDNLLDHSDVTVSEEDMAAYRKGFELTKQIEATISSAVKTQVLAGGSPKENAKRMQYFMQVAQECFNNGNFFAAHAIATALMGDAIKDSFKNKQGDIPEKSTLFSKRSPYWQPAQDARSLLDQISKVDDANPRTLEGIEDEEEIVDLLKQQYIDYVGEQRQAFPIPIFSSFMENMDSAADPIARNSSLTQLLLLQSNFTPYVRLNSREGERARVQPNPSYAAAHKMTLDPTIDPKKVPAEKGWKTVGGLAQDAFVARPKTFKPSQDERMAIPTTRTAGFKPSRQLRKPPAPVSKSKESFEERMEAFKLALKSQKPTIPSLDKRMEALKSKNSIQEGLAEDVSDRLVELHQELFNPAQLAEVLYKNPADTADFLTLKIVSFFRDIDFTKFRDRLLDDSDVRIAPQEMESYKVALDTTETLQENIADLVKNKVLSGKSEKERTKHMQYFMQVAEKCFENGNFFAADAIVKMLLSDTLKGSFKDKSGNLRRNAAALSSQITMAKGAQPVIPERGRIKTEKDLVETLQDQYCTYVKTGHQPPPIPIFSDFRKNLSPDRDDIDKRFSILQLLLFQSNFTPMVRLNRGTTINRFQADPSYATAHKTTLSSSIDTMGLKLGIKPLATKTLKLGLKPLATKTLRPALDQGSQAEAVSLPPLTLQTQRPPTGHVLMGDDLIFPKVPLSSPSSVGSPRQSRQREVEPKSPRTAPQPSMHLGLPLPPKQPRKPPADLPTKRKGVEKEFETVQSESPSAARPKPSLMSKLTKSVTRGRKPKPDVKLEDMPSHRRDDSFFEELSAQEEALEDFGLEHEPRQSKMTYLQEDFPGGPASDYYKKQATTEASKSSKGTKPPWKPRLAKSLGLGRKPSSPGTTKTKEKVD